MENRSLMDEDGVIGDKAIVKRRMEVKISAKSGAYSGIQSAKMVTTHSRAVFAQPNVLMV